MNKKQFLVELQNELKRNNIDGIEDILLEFEEHFNFKLEEGKTEEEIARKLGSPQEIAKEYVCSTRPINKYEKSSKVFALTCLSIPASLLYVVIWLAVIVVGAFSLLMLALGVCLITTINIAEIIPSIPYLPALFIGMACIGLSIIAFIGMIYMFLYAKHWGKLYAKWCRAIVNNLYSPASSKQPNLSKKLAYKLKIIGIVGLICFVITFILGYALACIYAQSFEPWHIWQWFQK